MNPVTALRSIPVVSNLRWLFLAIGAVGLSYGQDTEGWSNENRPEAWPLPEIESYDGELGGISVPIGETLSYRITWGVFHVANSQIEMKTPKTVDGEPAYHISMFTQTHGFVNALYKVKDLHESFVNEDFTRTLHYRKRTEGNETSDSKVVFNWETQRALRTDWGLPRPGFATFPESALDPLSITFAYRAQKLELGEQIRLFATDGWKTVQVDIDIEKEERIKTRLGTFDCYLVEPDTKDLGGVFEKSDDATIQIWFNKAAPHVPIKMKSAVVVGSFSAELSNIEGPGREALIQSRVK